MDREKVIEILEFYREIDGEVSEYRRILHDYESQYYNTVGGTETDGQPRGKNRISRPVEDAALNVPEYVRGDMDGYEAKVKDLQRIKAEILREISRLKLREKTVVFDYYVHGMKWGQVAERLHYSERQCKNIRDAAVGKLADRFRNNETIRRIWAKE